MDTPFWLAWWLGGTVLFCVIDRIYWKNRWKLLLTANAQLEAGDFEGALQSAEAAAKKYPKDWRPLVTAAAACTRRDDPAEAIRFCEKAKLLLHNEPIELLLNRAVARALVFDLDQALEDANRAVLKTNAPQAMQHMALLTHAYVCGLQYKYTEALRDCNEAIKLKGDIESYVRRCWAFIQLNDIENAKADCDWMMENLSGSKPGQVSMVLQTTAIISYIDGDFTKAIEDQTTAIELHNQSPFGYINRAHFLTATNELERAISDLEHAEAIARSDFARGFIASNKARACMVQKQFEKSVSLANEAVTLCSRPEILCTRAAAYFYTGALEDAEKDLDAALQLDPLHAEIYWWKGRLLELRGNITEAEQNKKKAIDWHFKPYY